MKTFNSAGRFGKLLASLLLAVIWVSTATAQGPVGPVVGGVYTATATGPTPWVNATSPADAFFANAWTWSVAPGATPPDTCAAKVEVCNEPVESACTGNSVLDATGVAMADCTTKQAIICADGVCAFRFVRVNVTTFAGASATLRIILTGWKQ